MCHNYGHNDCLHPLPPSNVEICLCHTASSGHLCFSTLLGGRGALGSGEQGTWERIGSFFKSSKDLLHYSMLFLEMSQVFLTSIVDRMNHSSEIKSTDRRRQSVDTVFVLDELFCVLTIYSNSVFYLTPRANLHILFVLLTLK